MVDEITERLAKAIEQQFWQGVSVGRLIQMAEPHKDRINRYLKFPIETDPSIVFFMMLVDQLVKKMDEEGFK